MKCHCNYLESSFWSSDDNEVMCNIFSPRDGEKLKQWLSKQKVKETEHVYFQTSGSTGKAKWVGLSKGALLESARAVNAHLNVQIGAKWALALPTFHVGGFGILVRAFLCGGVCQVFHDSWDPIAFTRFVYTEQSEYISLVPTQVVDLVNERCVAPDSVKAVIVGGGALTDKMFESAKGLGWPVLRSYGMTESASQIATGDTGDGWMDVLVGRELRLNQEGLLEWRGGAAMSHYLHDEGDTFRKEEPLKDGWFTTQDRVELREGQVRVLGRADSLVKVLGELVNLADLEQQVREQAGCDCIIFTEPDERRGVKLIAVLEASQQVGLNGFSGVQSIHHVHSVAQFPRSPLGKVKRFELQKLLASTL